MSVGKMSPINTTIGPALDCNQMVIPTAVNYFNGVGVGWVVGIVICGVISFITLIISLEARYHIINEMGNWPHKKKSIILLGMYPVVTLNAMAGLVFPRAASVTDLTTYVYYSVCVYVFSRVLFDHYGGLDRMADRLRHEKLRLQSPPLCCCCCCLPEVDVTRGNLRTVELMVMQFVILRPLLMYCVLILVVDSGPTYLLGSEDSASDMLSSIATLNTLSAFTGVWGNMMLFKVSVRPLARVKIVPRFYLVQLVVSLDDLLKLILNSLVSFNVITCEPPLNTTATSTRISLIVKICLVFVCSIIARYYYRVDQLSDDLDEDLVDSVNTHKSLTSSRSVSVCGNDRVTPRHSYGSLEGSTGIVNPTYEYPNVVDTQVKPPKSFHDGEAGVVEAEGFAMHSANDVSKDRRRSSGGSRSSAGERQESSQGGYPPVGTDDGVAEIL